jgi:hypothetical protein
MSKNLRSFSGIFGLVLLILQFLNNCDGQDIEARIRVPAVTSSSVEVSGRFIRPQTNPRQLSLVRDYAGVTGLADRVSNVRLSDTNGANLAYRELIPGEYTAEANISSWSYTIDLTPIKRTAAASRLSWIGIDGGVLMVDDLLPQVFISGAAEMVRAAAIRVEVPPGWETYAATPGAENKVFQLQKVERAAFVVGRGWREKTISVTGCSVRLLVLDDWSFNDEDAGALAAEIFANYVEVFGAAPGNAFQIALYKFPFQVPFGEWEADTRGTNVTIASSDMPFRSQALQRLHEQLRHEIFHLWIPNGVDLPGDYAWFYEGFALYQSLKLGVAVNRIRFEDMLDTLSRAFNIDNANARRISLIAASADRWNGANTQVYARGLLIAFLCDLALLDASKGNYSTNELLRQFYQYLRGPNPYVDGTAAIIGSFDRHKELRPLVGRYINGSEAIDWEAALGAAGIEALKTGNVVNLAVKKKPSGRQRDLLDKLGYNNWRKLGLKR